MPLVLGSYFCTRRWPICVSIASASLPWLMLMQVPPSRLPSVLCRSHSVSVLPLNCSTPFAVRLMLALPLGHSSRGLDRVSYRCFTPASTDFCRMIVLQLSANPSADAKGPNMEIDLVGFQNRHHARRQEIATALNHSDRVLIISINTLKNPFPVFRILLSISIHILFYSTRSCAAVLHLLISFLIEVAFPTSASTCYRAGSR